MRKSDAAQVGSSVSGIVFSSVDHGNRTIRDSLRYCRRTLSREALKKYIGLFSTIAFADHFRYADLSLPIGWSSHQSNLPFSAQASWLSRPTVAFAKIEDNGFMPTEVSVGETDDPYFIALINAMLKGLVSRNRPNELWLIKIDNWFDHKWLRFSGIGTVDFNFGGLDRFDAALDEFYQDKVTFPPFNPNRIEEQWSFLRAGDHYVESPLPEMPHRSEKQPSAANLLRRIQDFSRSACFVWYSGNTVANGRGSLMVYELSTDRVDCWFASFSRRQVWKLQATKGASREEVERLLHLSV